MMRVCGHKVAFATERFWQIAVLAAAGVIGATSHADAAIYYWSDSAEPGLSRPDPANPSRRPKSGRHANKKNEIQEKESSKPQGPVIISISIDQQRLRLYDANGLFAESPISTGMRGHPTPMGVFSVIQKEKLHHSNIYSGAPMPFMQRITWSGIAIHAGVLPGYPASHGCIRMPMAFAVKMWNWTRMGARVVITPGEISPASFSHPLLATVKVAPQPMAADEPKPDTPVAKTDKAADDVKTKPAIAEMVPELRSTIGHTESVKPTLDEAKNSTPLREQTRTADASYALPARNAAVMSDASGSSAPAAAEGAARSEAGQSAAKPDEAVIPDPDDKTLDTKPSETTSAETKSEDAVSHQAIKVDEPKAETKAADVTAEAVKKPDESNTGAAEPAATAPARKDQTRAADIEKLAASKPATVAPKRGGQIAVFVSRKDSKLYVRQNLAPLFDVPVTIAPSDRPLGTHIFTAQVDKQDTNVLHWSVVSLPVPSRVVQRHDEDERASRRRKVAGAVEVKSLPAPDSPVEALDRLNLPPDVMARITEALTTGGSIIVSDQGIAGGETGEGTDFIVSLR